MSLDVLLIAKYLSMRHVILQGEWGLLSIMLYVYIYIYICPDLWWSSIVYGNYIHWGMHCLFATWVSMCGMQCVVYTKYVSILQGWFASTSPFSLLVIHYNLVHCLGVKQNVLFTIYARLCCAVYAACSNKHHISVDTFLFILLISIYSIRWGGDILVVIISGAY